MKNKTIPDLRCFGLKQLKKGGDKILKEHFSTRAGFSLTCGSETRVEEKGDEEYEYCWAMKQAAVRSFCGPCLSGT